MKQSPCRGVFEGVKENCRPVMSRHIRIRAIDHRIEVTSLDHRAFGVVAVLCPERLCGLPSVRY